jgi:hypothetical protein
MRRQLVASGAAVTAALALGIAVPALSQGVPNPPGNNGTIKIDDVVFDDHPNNEPHVGCVFQVDFYGYDEGDLDATVTFRAHPPTGSGEVLLTDTVFIGEDDNSGGGSQAGLDASQTYTLDLSGFTPHPQQGFHVKLTINAEGSQGADVKHKVFWVQECPPKPTPTPSETPSKTPTESPTTPPATKTPTVAPTTPVETPVPVPTEVPAGVTGGGSGSAGLVGLVLAGAAAAAGAAVVARRRFLHDS